MNFIFSPNFWHCTMENCKHCNKIYGVVLAFDWLKGVMTSYCPQYSIPIGREPAHIFWLCSCWRSPMQALHTNNCLPFPSKELSYIIIDNIYNLTGSVSRTSVYKDPGPILNWNTSKFKHFEFVYSSEMRIQIYFHGSGLAWTKIRIRLRIRP